MTTPKNKPMRLPVPKLKRIEVDKVTKAIATIRAFAGITACESCRHLLNKIAGELEVGK